VFGETLELLIPLKLAGAGTTGRRASAGAAEGEAMFGMCFVAGTSIQTPAGISNIEDIQLGDAVYAAQPGTNPLTQKLVVRVFHHSDRPIIRVTISDRDGRAQVFGVTPEHPRSARCEQHWRQHRRRTKVAQLSATHFQNMPDVIHRSADERPGQ